MINREKNDICEKTCFTNVNEDHLVSAEYIESEREEQKKIQLKCNFCDRSVFWKLGKLWNFC